MTFYLVEQTSIDSTIVFKTMLESSWPHTQIVSQFGCLTIPFLEQNQMLSSGHVFEPSLWTCVRQNNPSSHHKIMDLSLFLYKTFAFMEFKQERKSFRYIQSEIQLQACFKYRYPVYWCAHLKRHMQVLKLTKRDGEKQSLLPWWSQPGIAIFQSQGPAQCGCTQAAPRCLSHRHPYSQHM